MRFIQFCFLAILFFNCSPKRVDWKKYYDQQQIGSIEMPGQPIESVDTIHALHYTLVFNQMSSNEDNNLSFGYGLYLPTDLMEFDLVAIKKDSANVTALFDKMISGVEQKSGGHATERTTFSLTEPGVRFITTFGKSSSKAIVRIILFDNFMVSTNVNAADGDVPEETEERFFKSLAITPENRTRTSDLANASNKTERLSDKRGCISAFQPAKRFTVLSLRNAIETASSEKTTTACEDWKISARDIEKIVGSMKIISGTEWDLVFDVLSCAAVGTLEQEGRTYRFSINAGSWMDVVCGDSILRLGNYEKKNEHFFQSPATTQFN